MNSEKSCFIFSKFIRKFKNFIKKFIKNLTFFVIIDEFIILLNLRNIKSKFLQIYIEIIYNFVI